MCVLSGAVREMESGDDGQGSHICSWEGRAIPPPPPTHTHTLTPPHPLNTHQEEELNTELDLRLHLHEPRPSRIEQDIHNVRVTELLAHRDRVTRHSTSLTTSLSLQRNTGETLAEILKIEADKFSVEIESLDKDLLSCSKSKE